MIIPTFAFQMHQDGSSWASRNGAVQMFFLTPCTNQKHVFGCVAGVYIFHNVE